MAKVLENNGYKIKVRNDSGDCLLIAQRSYTNQGVSAYGRRFYKGMVWFVFGWCAGRKFDINGIPPTVSSKQDVLNAIAQHPSYTVAARELGLL